MDELIVNLALESDKTITIPYTDATNAEDVCISVCKRLKIGPLMRHLFALRSTGEHVFLMPSAKVRDVKNNKDEKKEVDFRVRFRMPNLDKLSKQDPKAFEYLFHQARLDVLENKVSNLTYEKCKDELSGLGILDMYRYMREKKIPKETVVNDYKKFMPKVILKKHSEYFLMPFPDTVKRKVNNLLEKLLEKDVATSFVIKSYMEQLTNKNLAPDYLVEVYSGRTKLKLDNEFRQVGISIRVCPINGLQYSMGQQEWRTIGQISDITTITISMSNTSKDSRLVIIIHKNGTPFFLWLNSEKDIYSFVSALDGYFRLSADWTMNICTDVETPSLKKLKNMKCHGPVGGEYSYAKLRARLDDHRANYYLIRECELNHDCYYIDVCVKNSTKPSSFKVQKLSDDQYIFDPDKGATKYKSIGEIVKAYSDPEGDIYLQECIYPNSDVSQVLLCRNDNIIGDSLDTSEEVELPSNPVCIFSKDLQQFKASKKQGFRGFTSVYRGMWRYTRGKKIEVAIKVLEQSDENYLQDYLNLLGRWAFLKDPAIVKLHGIYLTSNIHSVWQYCKHGPLDEYLRNNKNNENPVDQKDLVRAARDMASALFYLSENNLVHGKIRCRKIMVHSTPDIRFFVRLADPGIRTAYSPSEIHWLPVECYATSQNMYGHTLNQDYAKKSPAADVWALATTYYEIFSWGAVLETKDVTKHMKWYRSGERLKKPQDCPPEIYKLMNECWHPDPYKRKHPQELLRDMHDYYYLKIHQLELLKKASHHYDVVDPPNVETPTDIDDGASSIDDDQARLLSYSEYDPENDTENSIKEWLDKNMFSIPSPGTSMSTLPSEPLPTVFELGYDWNVVPERKIGEGFFSEVFIGSMEPQSGGIKQTVAIKKLRQDRCLDVLSNINMIDFEREIKIMKSLKHDNIVNILGVQRDPDMMLVMEYVEKGSLSSYLAYQKDLKLSDLLTFALNIASGMEYLGKKNIVHRDLAARNVLVKERDHVKISDFGLAQFLNAGSDYYDARTKDRHLPIKWYALESLQLGKFSVKSDVWSYGVTLCEIFQFGKEPELIEALPPEREGELQGLFVRALEDGKRFPQPQECPRNIYVELIYPCWQKEKEKRPSFAELQKKIREILCTIDS